MKNFKFLLFFIFLVACKKELKTLEPSTEPFHSEMKVQLCVPDPSEVAGINYYIFINDISASQADNDPLGQLRFTPIFDFTSRSRSLPNDRYGLILFSDAAVSKIAFQNQETFNQQLVAMWQNKNWQDIGFSNLAQGLELARTQIMNVAKKYRFEAIKPAINFHIFLASDGYPLVDEQPLPKKDIIDIVSGSDTSLTGLTTNEYYKDVVNTVKIHTAYYWGNIYDPEDNQVNPEAKDLMETIAREGGGKFVEFGNGMMPDYSLFQSPRAIFEHQLVDLAVYPKNFLWDDARKTLTFDSDGDGLSDKAEHDLGSNPYAKDSDKDQVNDNIQFKTTGHVCTDSGCKDASSQINPLCLQYLTAEQIFRDSDGDGLNDCEEALVESNGLNADSNTNFLLDSIEYRLGFNISQKNKLILDSDGDGLSDRYEVQHGLPHMIHNSKLSDKLNKPMQYRIEEFSDPTGTKFCYNLSIKDLIGVGGLTNEVSIVAAYVHPFITKSPIFYEARAKYREGSDVKVEASKFKKVTQKNDYNSEDD
jgi:hypothetical protein